MTEREFTCKIVFTCAFFALFAFASAASAQTATATGRVSSSSSVNSRSAGRTRPRISRKTRKTLTRRSAAPALSAAQVRRIEKNAFDLINRQRRAAGARPLKWSRRMAILARDHSNDMAVHGYFSHRGLDGRLVDKRAIDEGLSNWRAIGENIAYMRGYDDPAAFAVERWMLSPTHRDNLLDRRWRESGIGLAVAADGTYYFTQVFMVE